MIFPEHFDYRNLTLQEYFSPLGSVNPDNLNKDNYHSELNRLIYDCLQEEDWAGTFEVIDFLHQLYGRYYDVLINKKNAFPFDDLGFNSLKQMYFFAYFLYRLLKETDYSGFDAQDMLVSQGNQKLLCKVMKDYEQHLSYDDIMRPEGLFQFDNVYKHLDSMTNLNDKSAFIIDVITYYKHYRLNPANHFGPLFDSARDKFLEQCEIEKDRIDWLILRSMIENQSDAPIGFGGNDYSKFSFNKYIFLNKVFNPLKAENEISSSNLTECKEGNSPVYTELDRLEEDNTQHTIETNNDSVSVTVSQYFRFMDNIDDRKNERILSDNEIDSLIQYVTRYFENNCTIPSDIKPIKRICTSKRNVLYTFNILFKELKPGKIRPQNYPEFIKQLFWEYRDDTIKSLNSSMGSRPKHYPGLVKSKKKE